MDTHNDPALLCGTTSYALYSDTSDTALTSAWAVLSGPISGVYTVTIDTTVDLDLIADEASVAHTIQVKATLDGYNAVVAYTQLDITITEAGCDCSYLAWDNPSHVTATVAVGTPYTGTVPVPTGNNAATSTVNDFQKCYLNGGTCAETGSYAASTGITYDDGSTAGGVTLPSWITYTSSGSTVQTVTFDPPDGDYIGTHTVLALFTSTHGADPQYTAFVVTVTCEVASFSLPSNPADVSYELFTKSAGVDLRSLVYTQSPACGYTYTSTLTWTGLETFITTDTDFVVDVYSQDIAVAGSTTASPSQTYALTLSNDLAITSNGPAGSSSFAASGTIGFSVTITNPCFATTIPTLTFSPSTLLEVTDGATGSVEFVRSVNGVETSTGVALVCGAYAFEVY